MERRIFLKALLASPLACFLPKPKRARPRIDNKVKNIAEMWKQTALYLQFPEQIVSTQVFQNRLLVFTQNHIYELDKEIIFE